MAQPALDGFRGEQAAEREQHDDRDHGEQQHGGQDAIAGLGGLDD
jgi:hypothetical protein